MANEIISTNSDIELENQIISLVQASKIQVAVSVNSKRRVGNLLPTHLIT
ncbi:MAG: hypothetical protein IJV56_02070 [Neisseriaceae bacterium]|nr:hypothetical protein [Neisseriaceae bacterium]